MTWWFFPPIILLLAATGAVHATELETECGLLVNDDDPAKNIGIYFPSTNSCYVFYEENRKFDSQYAYCSSQEIAGISGKMLQVNTSQDQNTLHEIQQEFQIFDDEFWIDLKRCTNAIIDGNKTKITAGEYCIDNGTNPIVSDIVQVQNVINEVDDKNGQVKDCIFIKDHTDTKLEGHQCSDSKAVVCQFQVSTDLEEMGLATSCKSINNGIYNSTTKSCYRFYDQQGPFDQSYDFCKGIDLQGIPGKMMQVNSSQEHDALNSIQSWFELKGKGEFWIDLRRCPNSIIDDNRESIKVDEYCLDNGTNPIASDIQANDAVDVDDRNDNLQYCVFVRKSADTKLHGDKCDDDSKPVVCQFQLATPVNCAVSPWMAWSDCSTTCGDGSKYRNRTITQPQVGSGELCPNITETENCNETVCPVDCEVSSWTTWSDCSATCGDGTKYKNRTVTQEQVGNGQPCTGPLIETDPCNNEIVCPVDCAVSSWTTWSDCSTTCGGGSKYRNRTVTQEQVENGEPCPNLAEIGNCSETVCPVNCTVSPWMDWSDCSTSCGDGSKYRNRTVTQSQVGAGYPCSNLTETDNCNETVCPVNCQVSPWMAWSACSTSCGDGSKYRNRTVTQSPVGSGELCPNLTETDNCNETICPVNCTVSAWSSWSVCSATCGEGMQDRNRTITQTPNAAGSSCPPLNEMSTCNLTTCPGPLDTTEAPDPTIDATQTCDCPGGIVVDGYCYTLYGNMNKDDAKAKCQQDGADLPMPKTEADNTRLLNAMLQLAEPSMTSITYVQIWLGLQQDGNGQWIWEDNNELLSSSTYVNWTAPFPNTEDCAVLEVEVDIMSGYLSQIVYCGWNDQDCDGQTGALCEKVCQELITTSTTPESTTITTGVWTTSNHNPCNSNPCVNTSICTASEDLSSYNCTCLYPYSGPTCLSMEVIDLCEEYGQPCQNNGTCDSNLTMYQCDCVQPWFGQNCTEIDLTTAGPLTTTTPYDPCTSNPCQSEASCSVSPDYTYYNCTCLSSFYGENCQYVAASHWCTVYYEPCENNGTCGSDVDDYWCTCAPQWTGRNCTESLITTSTTPESTTTTSGAWTTSRHNPCNSDPCSNDGVCTASEDRSSYNCTCHYPYYGPTCILMKVIDLCEEYDQPCQNNGTCDSNSTMYQCDCVEPWFGQNCTEIELTTTEPLSTSTPYDPCTSNPCQSEASCSVNPDYTYYNCTCLPTFYGGNCQNIVVSDWCIVYNKPCENNGTCDRNVHNYWCICVPPWTGRNCTEYIVNATTDRSTPFTTMTTSSTITSTTTSSTNSAISSSTTTAMAPSTTAMISNTTRTRSTWSTSSTTPNIFSGQASATSSIASNFTADSVYSINTSTSTSSNPTTLITSTNSASTIYSNDSSTRATLREIGSSIDASTSSISTTTNDNKSSSNSTPTTAHTSIMEMVSSINTSTSMTSSTVTPSSTSSTRSSLGEIGSSKDASTSTTTNDDKSSSNIGLTTSASSNMEIVSSTNTSTSMISSTSTPSSISSTRSTLGEIGSSIVASTSSTSTTTNDNESSSNSSPTTAQTSIMEMVPSMNASTSMTSSTVTSSSTSSTRATLGEIESSIDVSTSMTTNADKSSGSSSPTNSPTSAMAMVLSMDTSTSMTSSHATPSSTSSITTSAGTVSSIDASAVKTTNADKRSSNTGVNSSPTTPVENESLMNPSTTVFSDESTTSSSLASGLAFVSLMSTSTTTSTIITTTKSNMTRSNADVVSQEETTRVHFSSATMLSEESSIETATYTNASHIPATVTEQMTSQSSTGVSDPSSIPPQGINTTASMGLEDVSAVSATQLSVSSGTTISTTNTSTISNSKISSKSSSTLETSTVSASIKAKITMSYSRSTNPLSTAIRNFPFGSATPMSLKQDTDPSTIRDVLL